MQPGAARSVKDRVKDTAEQKSVLLQQRLSANIRKAFRATHPVLQQEYTACPFYQRLAALLPLASGDGNEGTGDEDAGVHGQVGAAGAPDIIEGSVGLCFSQLALTLLTITKDTLCVLASLPKPARENVAPADLIGMNDQDTITKVLEFTVALGLVPYITPGVVSPLADRLSQNAQVFKAVQDVHGDVHGLPGSSSSDQQLAECVEHLLTFLEHDGLSELVIDKALPDLMAAMIQLVYGPTRPLAKKGTHPADDTSVTLTGDDTPSSVVDKFISGQSPSRDAGCTNAHADTATTSTPATAATSPAVLASALTGVAGAAQHAVSPGDTDGMAIAIRMHHALRHLVTQNLPTVRALQAVFSLGTNQGPAKGSQQPAAKTPRWFKIGCGAVVSECIAQPAGICALFEILVGPVSDMGGSDRWKKYDHCARMIAASAKFRGPVQASEYYASVGYQVVQLLRLPPVKKNHEMLRAAGIIVSKMLAANPAAVKRHVFKPISAPLSMHPHDPHGPGGTAAGACGARGDARGGSPSQHPDAADGTGALEKAEIDEAAIIQSLEDIHRLFVTAAVPSANLVQLIRCVLKPLFRIHCLIAQSRSFLRKQVQEILETYFKLVPVDAGADDIVAMLFPELQLGSSDSKKGIDRSLQFNLAGRVEVQGFEEYGFAPGPSGGVVLRKCTENEMRDVHLEAQCVLELLVALDKETLTAAAFGRLLDAYVASSSKPVEAASNQQEGASLEEAAKHSVAGSAEAETEQGTLRTVLLLETLAQMCEELGPAVVSDFNQGTKKILPVERIFACPPLVVIS